MSTIRTIWALNRLFLIYSLVLENDIFLNPGDRAHNRIVRGLY